MERREKMRSSTTHIFIRPSSTKGIAMNIKEDIPLPNFIPNKRFCSIESSIVGETFIHGSMWSIHKRGINAINTSHVGLWFFFFLENLLARLFCLRPKLELWKMIITRNNDNELILSLIDGGAVSGKKLQWSRQVANRELSFLVFKLISKIFLKKLELHLSWSGWNVYLRVRPMNDG